LKKSVVIGFFVLLFFFYSCFVHHNGADSLYSLQQAPRLQPGKDSLFILPGIFPDNGNADSGYYYLLYGDAISSAMPYSLHKIVFALRNTNLAKLSGFNKYALNDFTINKNESGRLVSGPGCLHCHAQQFNNELVIGLGNSFSQFEVNVSPYLVLLQKATNVLYRKNSPERNDSEKILKAGRLLAPQIITEMQGPTPAHRIAELMSSHRDPQTLNFRADTSYFFIPPVIIPVDVPAWWTTKKKNAFTTTAMEQGNLLKHLMAPAILTFTDTAEARKIYSNIKHVWAYILTLKPKRYPYPLDSSLIQKGNQLFEKNCSSCHGRSGEKEFYPGKIVDGHVVGTDSLLWKYYVLFPEYAAWFNRSWFAATEPAAFIKPQAGYMAPPLDGIWLTAPYFHNGSVPTLEAVLNSSLRPRYWKRNFNEPRYDYKKTGWRYKELNSPGNKQVYNTDIPGYGNYGHYFSDGLTHEERNALLEYLKTL